MKHTYFATCALTLLLSSPLLAQTDTPKAPAQGPAQEPVQSAPLPKKPAIQAPKTIEGTNAGGAARTTIIDENGNLKVAPAGAERGNENEVTANPPPKNLQGSGNPPGSNQSPPNQGGPEQAQPMQGQPMQPGQPMQGKPMGPQPGQNTMQSQPTGANQSKMGKPTSINDNPKANPGANPTMPPPNQNESAKPTQQQ